MRFVSFLSAYVLLLGCAEDTMGLDGSTEPVDAGAKQDSGPVLIAPEPFVTCLDLMRCETDCRMGSGCSKPCQDIEGTQDQEDQLALFDACRAAGQCSYLWCGQRDCPTEFVTCLESSTSVGGSPAGNRELPAGSVPADLAGHWVSTNPWGEVELEFGPGGSVVHRQTKRSQMEDCSFSVTSSWEVGTAIEDGDHLTITLAPGTLSATFENGCATDETWEIQGRRLEFRYYVASWRSPPRLNLNEIACAGDACTWLYAKD